MQILLENNIDEIIKAVVMTILVTLALWEAFKKILEILNTYYKKKHNKDVQTNVINTLQNHDKQQEQDLSILIGAVRVQMRHSIVRIAEESLKVGYIGSFELQSLEELFNTYCNDLHGNSYVHNLMDKVRQLPIDYTNGNPKE